MCCHHKAHCAIIEVQIKFSDVRLESSQIINLKTLLVLAFSHGISVLSPISG